MWHHAVNETAHRDGSGVPFRLPTRPGERALRAPAQRPRSPAPYAPYQFLIRQLSLAPERAQSYTTAPSSAEGRVPKPVQRLIDSKEWKFFAALPRAGAGLATAWWMALIARGVL